MTKDRQPRNWGRAPIRTNITQLDVPYAVKAYTRLVAAKAITSGAPSHPQGPWVAWCVFDLSRLDLSGGYLVHHLCGKYIEIPYTYLFLCCCFFLLLFFVLVA
jgi:hypothetical protein